MNRYIILTEKIWHQELFKDLENKFNQDSWLLINSTADFDVEKLNQFNPDKIFIPHWSHIIPREIFEKYTCIVFHMTDLPFGRGGSPLQNLIVNGYSTTKISAIKVEQGLDTGDVYLKETLELDGTATAIFHRASFIIRNMIQDIIKNNIQPSPQVGDIVEFKRRRPADSNIFDVITLEKVYDYIRMLDCEGYPHAYIKTPAFKFEFLNASFNSTEEIITANVRIFKK